MAILAGIDEAGYGPLLGPLVSAVTVYEVSKELCGQDLWKIMSASVSGRGSGRSGKLFVADSKKVHSGKAGFARLERTALSFMKVLGRPMGEAGALLKSLRAGCLAEMREYPWYAGTDPELPAEADANDIAVCANALRLDGRRNGVRFAAAGCQVVLAGRFNELVEQTRNKAAVLLGLTGKYLVELVRQYGSQGLVVQIDKQGGRARYRPWLQRLFPSWDLRIVGESTGASSYEMREGDRRWEVHFRAKAESRHLPVALASIYAKYVRELFMRMLNAYWAREVEGLKRTGGYYVDGRRFLKDIEEACKRLGTPMEKLVRGR